MKTLKKMTSLSERELLNINGGTTTPTYDNPINYDAAVERGEAIVTAVVGFCRGLIGSLFS